MPKIMPGQRPAKARVSEAEKKWLACAIDCEGCLSLSYQRKAILNKKTGKRKTPAGAIRAYVGVDNTRRAFIMEVRRVMQGLTDEPIRGYIKNSRYGWRPCYVAQCTSKPAIYDVVMAVYPYLIVKRPQAKVMFRFLAIAPGMARPYQIRKGSGSGRGFRSVSKPNGMWTEKHHALATEMRRLNHRYAKGEWARVQRTTERLAPRVKKRSALTSDRERRQK